jgi:hypothetical protein
MTTLSSPYGVAVDAAGKIYITTPNGGVGPIGTLTTYTAKGRPSTPTITGLNVPFGVAVH